MTTTSARMRLDTVLSLSSDLSLSPETETTALIDSQSRTSSGLLASGTSTHKPMLTRKNLGEARRLLYLSHFFNQFSECTWQFCLVLFLAAFSNYQSLILVTSYGLVSYSFVCFFGPTAGRFIDGANRLQVAQQFIGFENCAVLSATLLCYILLSRQNSLGVDFDDNKKTGDEPAGNSLDGIPTDPASVLLLVGIHILGAIASVLDSGFLVAVERDWIVVMSRAAAHVADNHELRGNGNQEKHQKNQNLWLSDTNIFMRQIDLSCKIVAPFFAGIFVALFNDGTHPQHGYDLRGAALLVGGLNALALVVEYICTAKIYNDIPDLALKSAVPTSSQESSNCKGTGAEKSTVPHNKTTLGIPLCVSLKVPESLVIYFQQPICWAGFSLALLYLNVVLTFGGIMTAYLVWRGMSLQAIGLWRGVSSAAGLAGTFIYHFMAKKRDLIEVGMFSVSFQLLCLTSCYASLFVDNRTISFAMLIAGVCFSRIGLWVFDISVTQLMQQHIPAPIRGLVGGVQKSLNAFFTLVTFSVGLFFSDPRYFYIYSSIAFAGVALAAIFYGFQVYAKRKRIFISDTIQGLVVNEDA